eukprot:353650-Chlamydomonas_euryale.AAC.2
MSKPISARQGNHPVLKSGRKWPCYTLHTTPLLQVRAQRPQPATCAAALNPKHLTPHALHRTPALTPCGAPVLRATAWACGYAHYPPIFLCVLPQTPSATFEDMGALAAVQAELATPDARAHQAEVLLEVRAC